MIQRIAAILIFVSIPFIVSFISFSCIGYCDETKWGYSYGEFNHYEPRLTSITPSGIQYDPDGQNISPELIDRLTHEVEECLYTTFSGSQLTPSVISGSKCFSDSFQYPIDRTTFNVMIPNDWVFNCDGTQQELPTPVYAGGSGCVAKGQTPTEQCPCRWRAGVRCSSTIIATPSFYLYKDALTRFITNCQNPWATPELAACVVPTTDPLSNGSSP